MVIRRFVVVLLSIHFFAGSILLPKGDFALLADLPAMYHQYTQIDNPEDIGVIDFVADYLLNGEAIFGADTYKGHPVPYASVQFQHAANPLSCAFFSFALPVVRPAILLQKHRLHNEALFTPLHYNELLRPPVA